MIIFISFLTFIESVCVPGSSNFENCVSDALQQAGDRILALESVNSLLITENNAIKSELNDAKLEIETLKASNDLLNNQYNVLDSKIKAVEGRLDILEGDAGTDTFFP